MAPTAANQIVLAQNEYVFIWDTSKGHVEVMVGPASSNFSQTQEAVVFNSQTQQFDKSDLTKAITRNLLVKEGSYLILDNPVMDKESKKLELPETNSSRPANKLQFGHKINVKGPITMALWPGQTARVVEGHRLRSNQYLIVRVYNSEEAEANKKDVPNTESLANGTNIVIEGSKVPFFIPPTGFEVIADENGNFVREALTLELLEYCVLLDEDGNKRYPKGPSVVFPTATERFIKKEGAIKFKAIELNDQMGLYIKVTGDYSEGEEGAKDYKKYETGEELFVTGRDQRIYYPRPEHALIEYKDVKHGFNRQRYYAITIPAGEARYVLDKNAGIIKMVTGPKLFLPDPRNEVIVRRILGDKEIRLMYPTSPDALQVNQALRGMSDTLGTSGYITEASVAARSSVDATRSINRGTAGNKSLTSTQDFSTSNATYNAGDVLARGGSYTPPPQITLDTKYDGVPSVEIWTGYAVQVTGKDGRQRVEIGPKTVLLAYDEKLTMFSLSTGKPKTTDRTTQDVYLRVENNIVSDIIEVESKDLVTVKLKLSYRVTFSPTHKDKWFSVDNYVKFLCDHCRSFLKAASRKKSISELMETPTEFIRNTILGEKPTDGARTGRLITENGMHIYDVEVLEITIEDSSVKALIERAQKDTVADVINITTRKRQLETTKTFAQIEEETIKTNLALELKRQEAAREKGEAECVTALALSAHSAKIAQENDKAKKIETELETILSKIEHEVTEHAKNFELGLEKERTDLFVKRMNALSGPLMEAIIASDNKEIMTELYKALAPLALHEQQGLTQVAERLFQNTDLGTILQNTRNKAFKQTSSKKDRSTEV